MFNGGYFSTLLHQSVWWQVFQWHTRKARICGYTMRLLHKDDKTTFAHPLKLLCRHSHVITAQVAERLGLLAELQRVAVLFVGLSFEGVGNRGTEGDHPRPSASTRWPGAGISSSSSVRLVKNNGKMEVKRAGTIVHQRDDDGQFAPVKREVTDMADSALGFLQASFALLQSIVAGHGGVIKELSVDDKGTVRLPQDFQCLIMRLNMYLVKDFRLPLQGCGLFVGLYGIT